MARRITQSAVNWSSILERVPESERAAFNVLKARTDNNLRKMLALPEKAPAIDWAFYKSKVANPALVDSFQKKYETLQIPYPQDNATAKINEQDKSMAAIVAKDIEESKKRIVEYEAKLAHINSQIPITEMTLEEYAEAYPNEALDPINRPTAWPHDPEEIREHEEELAREARGEKPAPKEAH